MKYDLPTTTLGRTGLTVTRLGIGGAYCETPEGYRAALDCGVNYLDTARAYRDGEDERVVGQAIAGRRHEIVLASKSGARDAKGSRAELETSLRLLGTDYLDVWQIHYLNKAEEREQVGLQAVAKATDRDDLLLFYYSGHGSEAEGESYMVARDGRYLALADTAVPVSRIKEIMKDAPARAKVIILDACHSGADIGGKGPQPMTAEFIRRVFEQAAGLPPSRPSESLENGRPDDGDRLRPESAWLVLGDAA